MSLDKQQIEIAGCMRRLLRYRYVIRSRNEKWFQMMIENRKALQAAADTFAADVEINEPLGVAYLRPKDDETEEKLAIKLSRPKILGPFASAILIHLRWQRMRFYLEPNGSDVPIASAADLREFLEPFSRSKIDFQFERQFRAALKELTDLQVLIETGHETSFYEITSLCDLLLPADQVQELRGRADAYFVKQRGETNDA